MISLNESQIDRVIKEIEKQGVSSDALKAEVLDHACCSIESSMAKGKTFEKSLNNAIKSFGVRGLFKIENQIKTQKRKKGIMRKLRFSSMSIAACLVLLVLAVDAQERPEIKPLEEGRFRISSRYGMRMHPILKEEKFHRGVDMAVPEGTPVKVTADGVIKGIENHEKGFGKHIIVAHDEEYQTVYAQLSEFKVEVGQKVKMGDIVALSGNSGMSTAPHLHYEVVRNGKRVDPELYFSE